MSLNLAGLTVWADEISSGLVKKTVLEASTIKGDLVTVRYGLKGDTVKLNTVATTPLVTAACAGQWDNNGEGETSFNQSTMDICNIQLIQSFNVCSLRDYWVSWYQQNKFNNEGEMGEFEEVFYANIAESNHKSIDKLAWQGSYGAYDASCKGFLEVVRINSGSTAANIVKSAMTITNALDIIEVVKNNLPAEVIDNVNVYLSPADFQTYLTAVVNEYKYNATLFDTRSLTEFRHPTSLGMNIVRTNGLQGVTSGTMIVTPKDNIVLGISDESDLDLSTWYERKDDKVYSVMKLRMGTGYFFPEFVIRVY